MAHTTMRSNIAATAPITQTSPDRQMPQKSRSLRSMCIWLVVLEAFVVVTAIQGAIFVLPSLPHEWLHEGLIAPFSDYTIPALALGILCGGGMLLAMAAVLIRPLVGGAISFGAGTLMVGFELVEILVVGFTAVLHPTQPPAWLQIFYLVVGSVIALLGARLWKEESK